jgi:hypothetical protein
MMRMLVAASLGLVACKEPLLDHCRWKGEHVFCAATYPDAPFCSPCARLEQMNGCVAEPPSEKACPEFEPPETSGDSAATTTESSSTGG